MKNHGFARKLSLVLAIIIALGTVNFGMLTAYAAERYSDTNNHWASDAIERWSDYDVLNGYHGGSFKPNAPITRAETAAVLTRVIGYTEMGANLFSDVDENEWYFDYILKLSSAEIMLGSEGKARPQDYITREEAAALIVRAFNLRKAEANADITAFKDAADISDWAVDYVNILQSHGYISGKPGGIFDPKANITRAEIVTIIDNIIKGFYSKSDEYSDTVNGNAVINADGVILKDTEISRSLYITEGVDSGDVTLENVNVGDSTFIRGGGANSVNVSGGKLGSVVLNSKTGTHLSLSNDVKTNEIKILNTGRVTREGITVAFNADTGVVTLGGVFESVELNKDGTMTIVADGVTYIIASQNNDTPLSIDLTENSTVAKMTLNEAVRILGTGEIKNLIVHASGTVIYSSVKVKLENIIVDEGITITIGDKKYTGKGAALAEDVNSNESEYSDGGGFTDIGDGGQNPDDKGDEGDKGDGDDGEDFGSKDSVENIPSYYEENCDNMHAVVIISPAAITYQNLGEHVDITSTYSGEIPNMKITSLNNNEYTLIPAEPYESGYAYTFTLLNDNAVFKERVNDENENLFEGVRVYTFRIFKENIAEIEYNESLVDVLWTDVITPADARAVSPENGIYVINDVYGDFEEGDIVRFCDVLGRIDENIRYRTVISAEKLSGNSVRLVTRESDLEEVFDYIDLHMNAKPIDLMDAFEQMDLAAIENELQNSEGTLMFMNMIQEAVAASPTVQELLNEHKTAGQLSLSNMFNGLNAKYPIPLPDDRKYTGTSDRVSPFKIPSNTAGRLDGVRPAVPNEILGYIMPKDLKISANVSGTDNANFSQVAGYIDDADSDVVQKWGKDFHPMLNIDIEYTGRVNNAVDVYVHVIIKEYLSASVQGAHNLNIFDEDKQEAYFDYAVNLYSQTDINLSIYIKSVAGTSDDRKYDFNITDEVEALLNGEKTDAPELLGKVLRDKGDYINFASINIIDVPIDIVPEVPLARLRIKLNLNIKASFSAGVWSEMSFFNATQIGVRGNSLKNNEFLAVYNNELIGNNRHEIRLKAAGYAGLKVGLEGKLAFSIIGLEKLASFGASLEIGGYFDMYGFIDLYSLKRHQYKDVETVSTGAMCWEVGIYIELGLFAESEIFKVASELDILDLKIKIYESGTPEVISKINIKNEHLLLRSTSIDLIGGIISPSQIDIRTGAVKPVTSWGSGQPFSSLGNATEDPYFRVDSAGKLIITPPKGVTRLDTVFTVICVNPSLIFDDVYTFGSNHYPCAAIPITWIDPSVVLPDDFSPDDTCKIKYIINMDGKDYTIEEKEVFAGVAPGEPKFDLSADSDSVYSAIFRSWLYRQYLDNSKSWDGDFDQPVFKDTVYRIETNDYQILVNYIMPADGAESSDEWIGEVWAVDVHGYIKEFSDVPPSMKGFDFVTIRRYCTPTAKFEQGGNYSDFSSKIEWDFETNASANFNYLFSGYDTTKPVFTVAGTRNECGLAIDSNNGYITNSLGVDTSYAAASLYSYTAVFNNSKVDVMIIADDQELEINRTKFTIIHGPYTRSYNVGDYLVDNRNDYVSAGLRFIGWEDEDGTIYPDLSVLQAPEGKSLVIFKAIVEKIMYPVDILDWDGGVYETIDVGPGNYPALPELDPIAKRWEYKIGDGGFNLWEPDKNNTKGIHQDSDPEEYVNAPWTFRPADWVYVKFTWGAGDDSTTLKLAPGKYPISDLLDIPKGHFIGEKEYGFNMWGMYNPDTGEPDISYSHDDFIEVGRNADMNFIAGFVELKPSQYTVTFVTEYGELSTGGKEYTLPETYSIDQYAEAADAYIKENSDLTDTSEPGFEFKFIGWYSINLDSNKGTVVYTAHWTKTQVTIYYTVTFNAGDGGSINGGTSQLTERSAEKIVYKLSEMARIVEKTDKYNTYVFEYWKGSDGKDYGFDEEVIFDKDLTLTAVYEETPIEYTIEIYAGTGGVFSSDDPQGGTFNENKTVIRYSGYYNDTFTVVPEEPVRASDAEFDYVFSGWDSEIPTAFTGNFNIAAQYDKTARIFVYTFNAGDGEFDELLEGDKKITVRTFAYGHEITEEDLPVPSKASDSAYDYVFNGWYITGNTVTADGEAMAYYTRQLKPGGALPTGTITVSDGATTESISEGNIAGYTYALAETEAGSGIFTPTLTITGNGLTLSGRIWNDTQFYDENDMLRVVIASGVNDITFDNFDVTCIDFDEDMVVLTIEDSEDLLTISVIGELFLRKQGNGGTAIYSGRDLAFVGIDSTNDDGIVRASANIGAFDGDNLNERYTSIKSAGSISIENLLFQVVGTSGEIEGDFEVIGNAEVSCVPYSSPKGGLNIRGDLIFIDFTGKFTVGADTTADGEGEDENDMLRVYGDIKYIVVGVEADPSEHGLIILTGTDTDGKTYKTIQRGEFGIDFNKIG